MTTEAISQSEPAKASAPFDVEHVRKDFPALALTVYGKPIVETFTAKLLQSPMATRSKF